MSPPSSFTAIFGAYFRDFPRRIKSLEAQVSEIRQTQVGIHNTLIELVHQLRSGPAQGANATFRQSPSTFQAGSPASLSTPTSTGAAPMDTHNDVPPSGAFQGQHLPPLVQSRHSATPRPTVGAPYRSSPAGPGQRPGDMTAPHLPPPNSSFSSLYGQNAHAPTLPPISSFPDMNAGRHASSNLSSVRYNGPSTSQPTNSGHRSPKRKVAGSSNVTSSNTSDYEDEDDTDLPSKGLVAPWEVLRGLADVAAERAAQVTLTSFMFLLTCILNALLSYRRVQKTASRGVGSGLVLPTRSASNLQSGGRHNTAAFHMSQ